MYTTGQRLRAGIELGGHAAAGHPTGHQRLRVIEREPRHQPLVAVEHTRHIGHQEQFIGAERRRDGGGRVIPVHVVRTAPAVRFTRRHRRDDRQKARRQQRPHQPRINHCRRAGVPERGHVDRHRTQQRRVLTGNPYRRRTGRHQGRHQLLVGQPRQHHAHEFERRIGGHPAATHEHRLFTTQPLQRAELIAATMHAHHAPTGAMAMESLAVRLEGAGNPAPRAAAPGSPLAALAELPRPQTLGGRCRGPGCGDCGVASLGAWNRIPLAPGSELWMPPQPRPEGPGDEPPLEIRRLEGGRAWLRPPLANPWASTGAVVVADRHGNRQDDLSRRYPQPWPACLEAARGLGPDGAAFNEPEPEEPALEVAGTVLALADLSAEIHYHWLLEQLPRLGLALEALGPEERADLRVGHNGGADPARLEALVELLGVEACQLIDGRRHPHLRAELLLVPGFTGRFGWPSPQAQRWLRHRLLPPQTEAQGENGPRRRLWLSRRPSARRPVWGEAALLEHLSAEGMPLEAVDLADLGLREQAQVVSEAELVVAPHGGALASLVFARSGTRVMELHQPRYAPPYFHGIVQAQALRYARCVMPAEAPCLYQDLVFEGPLCEPISLDPDRCAQALRGLLSHP